MNTDGVKPKGRSGVRDKKMWFPMMTCYIEKAKSRNNEKYEMDFD